MSNTRESHTQRVRQLMGAGDLGKYEEKFSSFSAEQVALRWGLDIFSRCERMRDKSVVSQEGGVPAVSVCGVRGTLLVPPQARPAQEARLLRRGHGGQHQVRRDVDII